MTTPPPAGRWHGGSAARGVVDGQLALHRLDEPARDREPQPDAVALRVVTEALERTEHLLALVARDARALVGDRQLDAPGDATGEDPHRTVVGRGLRARSPRRSRSRARAASASACTRGSVSGTSTTTRSPVSPRLWSAAGTTSSSPTSRQHQLERAGLEPAHVEKVADEVVQAIGLLVDRGEQLGAGRLVERDVLLEQAGDRRLDRGQWRAQVVRHRGQERGAQVVRLREPFGRGGLGPEPAPLDRQRELARERAQRVEVLFTQSFATHREDRVRVERHAHLRVVGSGRHGITRRCSRRASRRPRAAAPTPTHSRTRCAAPTSARARDPAR